MTEHLQKPNILTANALNFAGETLGCEPEKLTIHPVTGGYSLNKRAVVECENNFLFVKEVDDVVLKGDGEIERNWLAKDYNLTRVLRTKEPAIVTDRSVLSEDKNVLVTSAYRKQDGWLWSVPEDEVVRREYVDRVITSAKALEKISFSDEECAELGVGPYMRDKIAASGGLEMLDDVAIGLALTEKYDHILSTHALPDSVVQAVQKTVHMIQDEHAIALLIAAKDEFKTQPQDCFGHCDLRSDNLTFNNGSKQLIFIDWNWASFVPQKAGSTEFLIDVATKGYDTVPWHSELNLPMLAACVGFWFNSALKPSFNLANPLREVQSISAAMAYSLYIQASTPVRL